MRSVPAFHYAGNGPSVPPQIQPSDSRSFSYSCLGRGCACSPFGVRIRTTLSLSRPRASPCPSVFSASLWYLSLFLLSALDAAHPAAESPESALSAGRVADALHNDQTGCRSKEVALVLGSRLSLGQEDSPRPRGHLRPTRPRSAPPRRRPHRGPGNRCLSSRSPLAPCAGRRRPSAHSGAVQVLSAPAPHARGGGIPGLAREFDATPMGPRPRLNYEAQTAGASPGIFLSLPARKPP
jgi:hypothetical protein